MKGKFQGGSIKGSIFTLIMATIGTGIKLSFSDPSNLISRYSIDTKFDCCIRISMGSCPDDILWVVRILFTHDDCNRQFIVCITVIGQMCDYSESMLISGVS